MKRLLILASALVIALLLAAGAWLLLRPAPKQEAAQVAGSAPASDAVGPVSPAPADLVDVPAPQSAPADVAESTQTRRDASQRQFDPTLAWRVRGVVELPAGLPADERLAVVAYENAVDPRAKLRREGSRSELEPLAEAALDSTGNFELALPPDAENVWLVLDARYLRQLNGVKLTSGADDAAPRLKTELGAWISGHLSPPRGVDLGPDELEDLTVTWAPGEITDFTQAGRGSNVELEPFQVHFDSELAFEFGALQAVTTGDLRVVPESLAAYKSPRLAPKPGEHLIVDLTPTRGGTLSGRVVDEHGAGVAKAKLTIEVDPLMMGMGGFEVRKGVSAEDGSFMLAAVLPGKLNVRAQAEGYLDHLSELELHADETRAELLLDLSAGSAIAGFVHWADGRPAQGADVNATFDMANMAGMGAFNAMRGPKGDGEADAQGAFRITGLGKGPFTVTAKAKLDSSDASSATWSVVVNGVKPETLDLELKLVEQLVLDGRVVDENGDAVTSFSVVAQEKTGGMIPGLGGQTVSETFTHEQGHFRLEGLSPRTWTLVASGAGADSPFARGESLEVVLPAAPSAPEVLLVLPHSSTISGVVRAPDGQPVGAARVSLQLGLQGLAAMGTRGGLPPSTSSLPDGTFVLGGLTPGALSLAATSPDFAKSTAVAVDLPPAGQVADVVLTLRLGGRIVGEIYAKDGSPMAGATILAQIPTDLTGQLWATSDNDGKFLFENVAPGTWQVMTLPGRGSMETMDGDNIADFITEMKFQMAEVIEGEDVAVVLGALPANPVKVSGRVLVDGEPQEGALVNFMHDGKEGAAPFKMTVSGKGGSYSIDLDRPGGYLVQVQKMQGATGQQQSTQLHFELPAEPEQSLDLNLPVGSISGLVRGPDGQPLSGARVTLTIEGGVSNLTFGGGQYAEIASDQDGRYQLVWLREGHYSVGAGGPLMGGMFGGADDAPARQMRAGLQVREGQSLKGVDFRLRAPGRLKGTVKDSAGKPVEGAAVFVRDENGQLLERISMAATDASGRFTYSGIGEGKYLVHARSTSQVSTEALVSVREGEDAEAHLVVDPGSILLVVLSDGDGNDVDCSVTVTDDAGRQVNGTWSMADLMALFSSGQFTSKEQRVGPVPAGRYTIHATTAGGLSATKRVNVSGQAERKINLRLKD